jgi:threonine dehydrogenase-like Zn-dependent dehydrogenase
MSDANEHRYDTGQTVWLMLFGHEIMGTVEEVLTHPEQ